ncbi:MAG: Holliday junction branch migration DNA helicase RuvB [Actinobacteria bacterium]|nr:Holliday junction branch migration DNA helicase RuvB [Actinomycetota bacterium]
MTDELLSSKSDSSDLAFEGAIRPNSLNEFVGQTKVREQIKLLIDAANIQSRTPDHILLAGPPGLGKTTLAMIVGHETGKPVRLTSGPAIQHAGDLASILSSLYAGEVLFIDEIHRMSRAAEELLYLAMEDYRVDVMVGKGAGANSISLDLEPFTLIGATTRSGLLPNPLRDRFGFTANLDFYSSEELHKVLERAVGLMSLQAETKALESIASRSRGTPRIANRLLRRVRDFALVNSSSVIDLEHVNRALELYEVDNLGLDRLDKAVLRALIERFGGKPVGLNTLSVAIGEEPDTIEYVVEPYLIRADLLVRTTRGRQASALAYQHLGFPVQQGDSGLFD